MFLVSVIFTMVRESSVAGGRDSRRVLRGDSCLQRSAASGTGLMPVHRAV